MYHREEFWQKAAPFLIGEKAELEQLFPETKEDSSKTQPEREDATVTDESEYTGELTRDKMERTHTAISGLLHSTLFTLTVSRKPQGKRSISENP